MVLKNKIAMLLLVVMFLSGCGQTSTLNTSSPDVSVMSTANTSTAAVSSNDDMAILNELEVYKSNSNPTIDIVFVDVGQGDSAFIVTPNNDVVLIDTGDDSHSKNIIQAFNKYEVDDIDLMILSHPHADHIGGASEIIDNYQINEILMNSYKTDTKTYKNLMEDIYSKNIQVTTASVNQTYNIDGVEIKVLATDIDMTDCNESSIVCRVKYGNVSTIFAGDAGFKTENYIISNNERLYTNILKVGHHGSKTSTSQAFIDKISPEIAIISCGAGNEYGHPHVETLQRLNYFGTKTFTTMDKGTITIRTNGDDIVMN